VTRRLRAASDAVVVGAATVAADDPALTVRSTDGALALRQPLRVVLVRDTTPPADSRVFTDEAAETLVLDGSEGLARAFAELGERGLSDVLVEPGPKLLTALWSENLVDELVVVSAGGMAGKQAPDAYLGEPDRELDALVHRMMAVEAGIVGDVSVTVWRPVGDAGQP
jgi:diaminohydroxyphosphoribosylaminopyrimidine deaminase/5-amino-6-(5-phosphoribosylamino)uracil reductase